jgi:hypothetical protein
MEGGGGGLATAMPVLGGGGGEPKDSRILVGVQDVRCTIASVPRKCALFSLTVNP